ncbi:MAG: RluA family pseudouridine synthase [Clostridia bacterium]|nr:RluA family pseudouridine synthase [Clostridia bacterium]
MDRIITIPIDASLDGKSIKHVLRNEVQVSAAILTQLKKEENGILLSGEPAFVTRKVQAGDVLQATIRDGVSKIEPREVPLEILYEDEDVIAVNKPRNMPTHPSQNHHGDTLANGLMEYFRGQNFTFRAITRLDKDTSGVVLVAKNPLSGAILVEEMKEGRIRKEYLAVTNGAPIPERGEISAPIRRREGSMVLRCVAPEGKTALTEYETISRGESLALVRLRPFTGRTHQLRVHLGHLGTPIFGDDMYGAPQTGEPTRLHCEKVSFRHPISREEIMVEAPIPLDMEELTEKNHFPHFPGGK